MSSVAQKSKKANKQFTKQELVINSVEISIIKIDSQLTTIILDGFYTKTSNVSLIIKNSKLVEEIKLRNLRKLGLAKKIKISYTEMLGLINNY